MNKQICIIIFLLTCRICNAQNLVQNPSFEDTLFCPTTVVGSQQDTTGAVGWYSFRNSPDYYNSCQDTFTSIVSIPINIFGYQYAATGNAYAGMQCFFTTNYREFLGSQLSSPLIIGQKYFVSLKVNCAFGGRWGAEPALVAVNKLGVLFSTVSYNNANGAPINNFAHIYTNTIITDTLNWVNINGSLIADSAYNYIIIGNFFDDAHTDTFSILQTPNSHRAYYFVDDVCVSTDSLTCNSTVGINEIKNEADLVLFPNPFSDKINISAKRNEQLEVSLYDVTSRKIFNQSFTNSTSINTEQLAKGIYLYEVRNKNGVIKQGKVVKD